MFYVANYAIGIRARGQWHYLKNYLFINNRLALLVGLVNVKEPG
jgi:hypothetical protein